MGRLTISNNKINEKGHLMQLQLAPRSETRIEAGYSCSCGCKPSLAYERGTDNQKHVCCCGTQLVVGKNVMSGLDVGEGAKAEIETFESPWGEIIEAGWVLGSGMHGHSPGHDNHGHSH